MKKAAPNVALYNGDPEVGVGYQLRLHLALPGHDRWDVYNAAMFIIEGDAVADGVEWLKRPTTTPGSFFTFEKRYTKPLS